MQVKNTKFSLKWLKIDCSWLSTSKDKSLEQLDRLGGINGVQTMT